LFKQHSCSIGLSYPRRRDRAWTWRPEQGRLAGARGGAGEKRSSDKEELPRVGSVLYASMGGRTESWRTRPLIAGRFGWNKESYFWLDRPQAGVKINRGTRDRQAGLTGGSTSPHACPLAWET
jgi:hypothetical protein